MISVVICSVTPQRFAQTRDNLDGLLASQPHEFIGIHDAKSIAEGYNRGIGQARGEQIIVCHDDIEILAPDFGERLQSRLRKCDLLGIAGSTRVVGAQWIHAGPPHVFGQIAHFMPKEKFYDVYVWGIPAPFVDRIKIMDGLFLAGHRRVFETVQFDQQTFTGFHLYDLDFTLRAFQAGFNLGVCLDFKIIHGSLGDFGEEWARDAEKFIAKHQQSFDAVTLRTWQAMRVKVLRKEQLSEVMSNPYWRE